MIDSILCNLAVIQHHAHIENITFTISVDPDSTSDMDDGHIYIECNAKVNVHKCTFEHGLVGICCESQACLNAKSCKFSKFGFAIYVEENASNINVVGCVFEKCGCNGSGMASCVVIICGKENLNNRQVTCIGNIFRNNLSYSVMQWNQNNYPKNELKCGIYSLRCNMLEGENQWIVGNEKIMDAN
eukprot:758765_1